MLQPDQPQPVRNRKPPTASASASSHQRQHDSTPTASFLEAMMSGRLHKSYTYLKVLLLLFLLNSLSLYFYFRPSSPSSPPERIRSLRAGGDLLSPPEASGESSSTNSSSSPSRLLKPWPILPSYLPWTNPGLSPPYRSCEAFFGNGFVKNLPVISVSPSGGGGGGGWFRCYFSETLRTSVCEGGSVRMDVGKIKMARGGEGLEEVMGRTEEEEMPVFEDGAFEVEEGEGRKKSDKLIEEEFVEKYIGRNKMGELIGSVRVVGKGELHCDQVGRS